MSLFSSPTLLPEISSPKRMRPHSAFPLREYQREDMNEVERLWEEGKQAVLVRWSTGLGKSVLASEVVWRAPKHGRTLVIVDVGKLSRDLFQTIRSQTGHIPAMLSGTLKTDWMKNRVVVCTKQALCAGKKGDPPRYESIDPKDFCRIVIDECESAVADSYFEMIDYFLQGNPGLRLLGQTATPFRTDKRGMSTLFDHANEESGLLNRDLQWAYLNGWLCKPKQGFIKTTLDYSSLKVSRKKDGEKDYSDRAIADLLADQDERGLKELAVGIIEHSKGRKSIVICPNTDTADRLAWHIDGNKPGMAISIHTKVPGGAEEASERIDNFKRGKYKCAVSVGMLGKGFDDDRVEIVYMARRTKSRRLYEQAAGRASRPLKDIRPYLAKAKDASERRSIISRSDKASFIVVDAVGVDEDAKNLIGVVDILGPNLSHELRERTRQNMLDQADEEMDVGDAARCAKEELTLEAEEEKERRIEERRLAREQAAKEQRDLRSRIQMNGDVYYEELDILMRKSWGGGNMPRMPKNPATKKQVNLLVAMGVKPETALTSSVKQAGSIISSYKKKGTQPDWNRLRAWERNRQGANR